MSEASWAISRRSVLAGGLATMLPAPALHASASTLPTRNDLPFATDTRLPGQLYAVLARPPVLGWSLTGFDARVALRVPGIVDVVAIAPWATADLARLGGLAVLARDTWSALKGREALSLEWRNDDAPVAGHGRAGRFVVPRTAESIMETPCATARSDAQGCDVWACLSDPGDSLAMLASLLKLRCGSIVLHPTVLGGRPGETCNPLSVIEAALLSRAMRGAPVSLVWTREDDIPFRTGTVVAMADAACRAWALFSARS